MIVAESEYNTYINKILDLLKESGVDHSDDINLTYKLSLMDSVLDLNKVLSIGGSSQLVSLFNDSAYSDLLRTKAISEYNEEYSKSLEELYQSFPNVPTELETKPSRKVEDPNSFKSDFINRLKGVMGSSTGSNGKYSDEGDEVPFVEDLVNEDRRESTNELDTDEGDEFPLEDEFDLEETDDDSINDSDEGDEFPIDEDDLEDEEEVDWDLEEGDEEPYIEDELESESNELEEEVDSYEGDEIPLEDFSEFDDEDGLSDSENLKGGDDEEGDEIPLEEDLEDGDEIPFDEDPDDDEGDEIPYEEDSEGVSWEEDLDSEDEIPYEEDADEDDEVDWDDSDEGDEVPYEESDLEISDSLEVDWDTDDDEEDEVPYDESDGGLDEVDWDTDEDEDEVPYEDADEVDWETDEDSEVSEEQGIEGLPTEPIGTLFNNAGVDDSLNLSKQQSHLSNVSSGKKPKDKDDEVMDSLERGVSNTLNFINRKTRKRGN